MNFTSPSFICFLVFVLIFYYLFPQRVKLFFLFAVNCLFYLGFGANFTLLLIAITAITFAFSLFIRRLADAACGKYITAAIVAITISPLLFFKYFDFFSQQTFNLLSIFGLTLNVATLNLMVPVGISFYTFRVLSYLFDVGSGKIPAEKNFLKYALYVTYFPQIVCGPIERASDFIKQANKTIKFDSNNLSSGTKLVIFGFFKKLVIADPLAIYVDNVYSSASSQSGLNLTLAAVFFSIQLYCDFSGYTDIATGVSKTLGFNTAENFRRPYFSQNIKEFWARWHISLSTWLRDYIYIPLGGNRCSKMRKYFNIMATFTISGLWHGANWTYIVWGAMHGFFLVVHDMFFPKNKDLKNGKSIALVRIFNVLFTFAAVTAAWIVFRADSFSRALEIFSGIVSRFSLSYSSLSGAVLPFTGDNTSVSHFLTAAFFICVLLADSITREIGVPSRLKKFDWLYYSFLLACVFCFGRFGGTNFIYAQF